MLVFNYEDATGEMNVTSMSPDGTVRPVSQEELDAMKVENHEDVVEVIMQKDAERDISKDDVFFIVEEMPEFPGGDLELRKYIVENIKYPEEAKAKALSGTVFVQFVVNKEGNVVNIKIARGIDPLLDAEAIRVVKNMPKWKPGAQSTRINGEKVWVPKNVFLTVPVKFTL